MILRESGYEPTAVNIHTEKKVIRKRKRGGRVSIVTEHEN